jgi:hypothetical protein
MRDKIIGWLCYKIVMAWPGTLPHTRHKWFAWMLAWAGHYANYPCENV